MGSRTWPHCDSAVLHAPDECPTCDKYSADLQEIRQAWGINFTGHYEKGLYLCPAEKRRPLSAINRWGGNSVDGSGGGFYQMTADELMVALAELDSPTVPTEAEIEAAKTAIKKVLSDLRTEPSPIPRHVH